MQAKTGRQGKGAVFTQRIYQEPIQKAKGKCDGKVGYLLMVHVHILMLYRELIGVKVDANEMRVRKRAHG